MNQQPVVSIILVNWNTRDLAHQAITTMLRYERSTPIEVILVDNASSDGSPEYLEACHPGLCVIRSTTNDGFAKANNRGARAASGRYLLLLNTDTLFTQEVLPECLAVIRKAPASVVGCRLMNGDGSLQLSADKFPRVRDAFSEILRSTKSVHAEKLERLERDAPFPVDWLCGAFLFMERDRYLNLGGLSEDIFMYGEDTEFCWRIRKAGVSCLYVPGVSIVHLGGGAMNHASLRAMVLSDAGRLRAFAKMRGYWPAALLRTAFIFRSVGRGLLWGVQGLLLRRPEPRRKALNHLVEILILAGLVDARRFV